jgi:hypothetical protein
VNPAPPTTPPGSPTPTTTPSSANPGPSGGGAIGLDSFGRPSNAPSSEPAAGGGAVP